MESVMHEMRTVLIVSLAATLAACQGEMGPATGEHDSGGDTGDIFDGSGDASGDADADADADADGDGDVVDDGSGEAWVRIVSPRPDEEVLNPVTFVFEASPEVAWVELTADDWPLHDEPLPADSGRHAYSFSGVNRPRTVVLTGFSSAMEWLAETSVTFVPIEEGLLPEPDGFNRYVVRSINDLEMFPKDGTYPYCYRDDCAPWVDIYYGMVHDAYYLGEFLFEGTGMCYCCGHTLEVFLDAYRRYQDDRGVDRSVPYGPLGIDDVNRGLFYRHWFGIDMESDAGAALEEYGIGETLPADRWDEAIPGDFVMFSRSSGSGHAVIFVDWIRGGGEITGIRYYGCNGGGDSHPDPDDPENTSDNSGPSFVTEMFDGHGGRVLPSYVFVGHPYDPDDL
jgi:hypothetical protein